MATNQKISQLPVDAAPARTDSLTSLEGGTLNRQVPIGSVLALTADTDITFTDNTTGDVSAVAHGFAPKGMLTTTGYLQYRDEKVQNTGGGTFTSGAWRTRTLNTEVADTGGHGTLAANQITLAAGTYLIAAKAPAYAVDRNQVRLQNVTDATTLLIGISNINTTAGVASSPATLNGIFTIGAAKALELQHQCATTRATDGFGVEANFGTEVYAVVELWKIG